MELLFKSENRAMSAVGGAGRLAAGRFLLVLISLPVTKVPKRLFALTPL